MESITKNNQSRETIEKMVEKFFSPDRMVSFTELTEGYFNMAYEVSLSNGEAVILKITSTKYTRIMTNVTPAVFSRRRCCL